MSFQSGYHFLQIPGPTHVPDRVLRAIAKPTIDHRGPEFARLTQEVLEGLKRVFNTSGAVVIYPSSGTGAWEAALVNTLSPGDKVLMFETGHFATLWRNVAAQLGLEVDFVPGDWRHGIDPAMVEAKLVADKERAIRAWNLEILCLNPEEYSPTLTTVVMPAGHDADALRKLILERFNMSLGTGLGKMKGKVFRIGHLGHFNDLMLAGTLSGVEMGLALARVPFSKGGVAAALDYLSSP